MYSGLSGYTRRSTVLLQAAERFEENLADTARLTAATRELLAAAEKDSFADVRLGFQGEPGVPGVPTPPRVSDRLSAVLFDLQSANILVAAGLHVALADLSMRPRRGAPSRRRRETYGRDCDDLRAAGLRDDELARLQYSDAARPTLQCAAVPM